MFYAEPVYRPPSEASSLLVQATIGCSHAARGHCFFCGSWVLQRVVPEKRFRVRRLEDIERDLLEARHTYGPGVRRVFFLDSNALVMKTRDLARITEYAYALFPALERVSVYACADDILRKSHGDLVRLRDAGLGLLYIGLESGSDEVLRLVNKGVSAERTVEACAQASGAGLALSLTVILGLGGRRFSGVHAEATGGVVSRISPDYLGALTLMIVPGTPLAEWVASGTFVPLSQQEILGELRSMIEHIHVDRPLVFRTNHASNYLPLKGTLPEDKDALLSTIRKAERRQVPLRPEYMRGL
jgi:radical SAM superfamily enzyme YgiQ (UPF0313 family)